MFVSEFLFSRAGRKAVWKRGIVQRGSLNFTVHRDVNAVEASDEEHGRTSPTVYDINMYDKKFSVVKSDAPVYIWSVSVTKNDLDTLVMCVYFNENKFT